MKNNLFPVCRDDILDRIEQAVNDYFAIERQQFAHTPMMLEKLDGHIQRVTAAAKYLYPDQRIVQVAALSHDLGRGQEFRRTGGFNGMGENSHNQLGSRLFLELMNDAGIPQGVETRAIFLTIRCHGLHNLFIEGVQIAHPDLRHAEGDIINLNHAVSTIDDITNGAFAYEYLYREQQLNEKARTKNGFIPDENQWSKEVSQKCVDAYETGLEFNRNALCRTYAEYNLFALFLAIRNLKSGGKNAELIKYFLNQPGSERYYDGDVLADHPHPTGLAAYEAICNRSMEPARAQATMTFLKSLL